MAQFRHTGTATGVNASALSVRRDAYRQWFARPLALQILTVDRALSKLDGAVNSTDRWCIRHDHQSIVNEGVLPFNFDISGIDHIQINGDIQLAVTLRTHIIRKMVNMVG